MNVCSVSDMNKSASENKKMEEELLGRYPTPLED